MKIALIVLAAFAVAFVVAMSFPNATIWQVALPPVVIAFAGIVFNFRKGH